MVAISGPGWRLAPCLIELIAEADERAPGRSHASDGSVGDLAHQARESDHNPADGWVCAVDLDDNADDENLNVHLLRAHIIASRDPRVKYVIHEGTIVKAYANRGLQPWTPQPYTGLNAHAKHLHVSVWNTDAARNDTSPWWPTEEDDMPTLEEIGKLMDAKLKASEDRQNTWIRQQLGIVKGENLYDKIRSNVDLVRDGLAKLIRGE